MLLLLFDTHAGEIMNDYSHLSISPQRLHVHPLKGNRNTRKCYRNHAKKTGGMCFLYLGNDGEDFVHSCDPNCEEVRRRERGFTSRLGCF